jgi:hypothetical protein
MDDVILNSFAKVAEDLRNFVNIQTLLPAPDAGLSLLVQSQMSEDSKSEFLPKWPEGTSFKYPPGLACFGFMARIDRAYASELRDEWVKGCCAVLERELFPIDRQSFTFRPIEVLGMAFGIRCICPTNDALRLSYEETIRECYIQGNSDLVSQWYYKMAEGILTEVAQPFPRVDRSSIELRTAALLKWTSTIPLFQSLVDSELLLCVEDQILRDVAIGKFNLSNVADASLLLAGLENSVLRRLQSRLNDSATAPVTHQDAAKLVVRLCRNFPLFAKQLAQRREDVKQPGTKVKAPRPTISMNDEYDVQDAFHAILKLFFEDVRTETWTPEYAANQKRIDFVLPDFSIAIEAKHTRDSLTQSSVADQLIIDMKYYRQETSCNHLICFVYDPKLRLRNPLALEKDLSPDDSAFRVTVIVCPHGK